MRWIFCRGGKQQEKSLDASERGRRAVVCKGSSLAIERAILNRFGHVGDGNLVCPRQIGNSARHFPDAIMGPRAQPVMLHRLGQQPLLRRGQRTVAPQLPHAHGRIMRNRRAGKALVLPGAGRIDAGADARRGLGLCGRRQVGVGHGRDVDLDVEAIEQRPGDAGGIALQLLGGTQAGALGVGQPSARTPV